MKTLGKHFLLELYDCDVAALNSLPDLRENMVIAAKEAGATVVGEVFHQFSPHGVSGVVVIAESHFSIHTWPEHNYAAVDLYTCGNTVDPTVAANKIADALKSKTIRIRELFRGLITDEGSLLREEALDRTSFPWRVPERQPIKEGYHG